MTDEKKNALIHRPGTGISTGTGRRTSPVITRMTQDVLALAQSQALSAARFRIGGYVLREPDYRQILRWAEVGGMAPEEVLKQLAESSVEPWLGRNRESIRFSLEDGSLISVAWDLARLPFPPENWEPGLLIRELGFTGRWPDAAATALRPVLPRLETLWCNQLALRILDLSQIPSLTELHCAQSELTKLDLSPVPGLTELDCGGNWLCLTELDLSPVPGLTELDCGNNNLTELDLSPVPGLTRLECEDNNLTELDLSPVPGLTELHCWRNQLSELDLSPVPGLTALNCWNNQLTELDLSPVPGLTWLECGGNRLGELDLSPVPGLTELDCGHNYLRELDLSPVPGLTKLWCRENNLTELDLSPVPGLTELKCDPSLRILNAPKGLKNHGGKIISYASTTDGADFDDDIPF